MEKKNFVFSNELNELREKILNAVYELLNERKIKSINMYAYWDEAQLDRCLFFQCDDDGYGRALYINSLKYIKKEKRIELDMYDVDDSPYATWDESDLFEASQMNYLLSMLEDIIEWADEENEGKILKAGETFDDWEE